MLKLCFIILCSMGSSTLASSAVVQTIVHKLQSQDRAERLAAITEARSLTTPAGRSLVLKEMIRVFGTLRNQYFPPNIGTLNPRVGRGKREKIQELLAAELAELSFSIGLLGKGNHKLVSNTVDDYRKIFEGKRSNPDALINFAASQLCEDILSALYSVDPSLIKIHQRIESAVSRGLLMIILARLSNQTRMHDPTRSHLFGILALKTAKSLMHRGKRVPVLVWMQIREATAVLSDLINNISLTPLITNMIAVGNAAVDDVISSNHWNRGTVYKVEDLADIMVNFYKAREAKPDAFRIVKKLIAGLNAASGLDDFDKNTTLEDLHETLTDLAPVDRLAEAETWLDDYIDSFEAPRTDSKLGQDIKTTTAVGKLLHLDLRSMRYYLRRLATELPPEQSKTFFQNLKAFQFDGMEELVKEIPSCSDFWDGLH